LHNATAVIIIIIIIIKDIYIVQVAAQLRNGAMQITINIIIQSE